MLTSLSTVRIARKPSFPVTKKRMSMRLEADLRRTWLFGPGADARVHEAMAQSGADGLIVDLEDFTPESRRDEAQRRCWPPDR